MWTGFFLFYGSGYGLPATHLSIVPNVPLEVAWIARVNVMTVRIPRLSRVSNLTLLLSLIPLALAAVVGCSGKQINNPPENIVAKPWTNIGEAVPSRDGDVDTVAGLSQVLAGK